MLQFSKLKPVKRNLDIVSCVCSCSKILCLELKTVVKTRISTVVCDLAAMLAAMHKVEAQKKNWNTSTTQVEVYIETLY